MKLHHSVRVSFQRINAASEGSVKVSQLAETEFDESSSPEMGFALSADAREAHELSSPSSWRISTDECRFRWPSQGS